MSGMLLREEGLSAPNSFGQRFNCCSSCALRRETEDVRSLVFCAIQMDLKLEPRRERLRMFDFSRLFLAVADGRKKSRWSHVCLVLTLLFIALATIVDPVVATSQSSANCLVSTSANRTSSACNCSSRGVSSTTLDGVVSDCLAVPSASQTIL